MLKLKHKNLIAIGVYGLAIGVFILTLPKGAANSEIAALMPLENARLGGQHAITEIPYSDILNGHLFGRSDSTQVKTFSQSNIKLMGVIFKGKENAQSQVILSINNREQFYQIGQDIPGVGKINTVEENRVLISTQDGLQALELFNNK